MGVDFSDFFRKDQDAFYTNANGKMMCQSVHGKSYFRYEKAKKESAKDKVPREEIIEYVNELLFAIGIERVVIPIMNPNEIDYSILKENFYLVEEQDIIWMKFTTDGHLGVVAQSNDIGFDVPTSNLDYDKKIMKYNSYKKKEEEKWEFTSSGILVHKLNKQWDESFVLVFPLGKVKVSCKYDRHDIETAIGNYLIYKNVPIIDYYSHNY